MPKRVRQQNPQCQYSRLDSERRNAAHARILGAYSHLTSSLL